MVSNLNKQIGKRVKYLRQIKGFSQEKLAEAIDIATNSLSLIETGNGFMSLSTLEKMSSVLGVEPYEIFKFNTTISQEEMYEYVKNRLEFIKGNEEKLRNAYLYFQNLI